MCNVQEKQRSIQEELLKTTNQILDVERAQGKCLEKLEVVGKSLEITGKKIDRGGNIIIGLTIVLVFLTIALLI